MVAQMVMLDKFGWRINVFYNSDLSDFATIHKALSDADCYNETIQRAYENMSNGTLDNGFTYSNLKKRKSVVVLGKSSDESQFANTWFHELIHLSVHIATALNLDLQGETMAYIGGYIAESMQPISSKFMCKNCKKHMCYEKG